MGTWLNNSDHPHFIDWCSLRTDLDYFESKMKEQKSVYSDMMATWRYHHSQFPRATIFCRTYDKPIDAENGFFKFS